MAKKKSRKKERIGYKVDRAVEKAAKRVKKITKRHVIPAVKKAGRVGKSVTKKYVVPITISAFEFSGRAAGRLYGLDNKPMEPIVTTVKEGNHFSVYFDPRVSRYFLKSNDGSVISVGSYRTMMKEFNSLEKGTKLTIRK